MTLVGTFLGVGGANSPQLAYRRGHLRVVHRSDIALIPYDICRRETMKDMDGDRCAHWVGGQTGLRTISTISTHKLNSSTLCLFLTTQLEAK